MHHHLAILLITFGIATSPAISADEPAPTVLSGHSGSVLSVAFSPDGRTLASSSRDDSIRLWEVPSGKLLRVVTGHEADVYAVAFSPDGKLLASGSADNTIRLWEHATGKMLRTFKAHDDIVRSVVFSPDGKRLASSSVDRTIRIWDIGGELLHTMTGHSGQVRSIAFSPDGRRLVSGGTDKTVRLWDGTSVRAVKVLEGHTSSIEAVAWSPDGKLLASSSNDTSVRLWDAQTGECLRALQGHSGEVDSIAFSTAATILASGAKDALIHLWDPNTGKLLRTLKGHTTRVESMAFSPNGTILATGAGGPESAVRLWTLNALASNAPDAPFLFRDVGDEAGVFPHVAGIRGHGAAWGDVDGDGWIDLYVATFHTEGAKPNMLLRNKKGKFELDEQASLRISTRGTGVVFSDLDNDGDLDLYVASMPAGKDSRLGQRQGHSLAGCSLFRNEGGGKFVNVSEGNGACPPAFGGRSATVLDFDGDGLLDLLVGEDPIPGYNGSTTKSSRVFHNKGNLQFEDVSRAVGLPEGIPGLGVAAADVNNDGWPDIFLASSRGGNVLFLNDGHGKFVEAPGSRTTFAWKGAGEAGGDNMICGVCFGDVNRDGLLDMVLGQHYSEPWKEPIPNRLYLNRGNGGFEDVTERAGLIPLGMKAPHVEIQDLDNDGWPDIYQSVVKFKDSTPHPVIFKHLGIRDGLPRFSADAWSVNDFPTPEDRAVRRSGELFDRIIREKKIIYMAPGPTGDFDNDGRLDLFLPNWWIEGRSLLLRNETPGGNWLRVQVESAKGVNRMGIGARVNIYPEGKLSDASSLLGCREIATGYGYASGQPAYAHFGLGTAERVDVEVVLPHGRGSLQRKGVAANQLLTVRP